MFLLRSEEVASAKSVGTCGSCVVDEDGSSEDERDDWELDEDVVEENEVGNTDDVGTELEASDEEADVAVGTGVTDVVSGDVDGIDDDDSIDVVEEAVLNVEAGEVNPPYVQAAGSRGMLGP